MKVIRISVFLLCCCLGSLTFGHHAFEIRVLSYNLHHGRGVDGKLDLERLAKVIRAAKPDLVALQEVDNKVKRSGNVDQPRMLAELTGMSSVYGANIPLQGGHYGNALLSRLPITASENRMLPSFDNGEQRGVIDATINGLVGSEPLQFMATHFDHRSNDRERIASAVEINQWINSDSSLAILAGDLNDTRSSDTLLELSKQWSIAGDEEMPTYPSQQPNLQIDFVLFRPANRWMVKNVQVLEEKVASDHRPILVTLALRGK